MTTVAAGSTDNTVVLYEGQSITITPAAGGQARLAVRTGAGVHKFQTLVADSPRTFGPFAKGDLLALTAVRGSVDYTLTTAAPITALPGRPVTRGRRTIIMGGSVDARGIRRVACTATGVRFVPDPQNVGQGTIYITTATAHKLHSGARIFLSNEDALAPGLNNGIVTADNGFAYGTVTVIDDTNLTLPFWDMMASTAPYNTLSGTSTTAFAIHCQEQFTPCSKFAELQRWTNHAFSLVMNIATGSNNSLNLIERLPALVAMARAGLFDELAGTLGIGNTALYALNHSWTFAQLQAQVVADLSAITDQLAPYGIVTRLDLPTAQLDSTGYTTAGTRQMIEAIRRLALDPNRRLVLEDAFSQTVDPATGLIRTRYQLNGTDNVHPGNEGCVTFAAQQMATDRIGGNHAATLQRLAVSALDSYKSDSTSVQLFDPMIASTPTNTAVSVGDAKCSGTVPDLIRSITTSGNASRSAVFSYEKTAEVYHVYALLTAAAAGDAFQILVANKLGTRSLENLLLALGAGTELFCGLDYSLTPLTGTWGGIDVYFNGVLSYGSFTNRSAYMAADTTDDIPNADGPMTGPRVGPAFMPNFVLPPGLTGVGAGTGLVIATQAVTAGTALLRFSRPTLRVKT